MADTYEREYLDLDRRIEVVEQSIFELGYRTVARDLHPDTSGDLEAMKSLNALVASVREQLAAELGSTL
jgi:hypothetical protein